MDRSQLISLLNGVIVASGATITAGSGGGNGYQVGDVVGIDTLGSGRLKILVLCKINCCWCWKHKSINC